MAVHIPKQVQRALPLWVAVIFFVLFYYSSASSLGPMNVGDISKRDLACQYMSTGSRFPRKIWQTWKVDVLDFEDRDLERARSWTTKNLGHRYEVLTDDNALHWVEENFGPAGFNRPDVVYMYRTLTAKIIKADLLRYLVMYVEGGIYSDIDVEALRPVNSFIPSRYDEGSVDMVIGVEIDQPDFSNHPILGKKSMSFCQWTFMAKPRLPVMMKLIDNIVVWLERIAQEQKVPISDVVLDFDEVISGTGPSAFTNAILADMASRTGQNVDWSYFHSLTESKLVGGVLVLTVEAFAAGQGHSNSGNHDSKNALVKHHYHASKWPTTHPRFKHAVYGEVEQCNWEPECVRTWDRNMAEFKTLPESEQAKQIAAKEAQDAASFDIDYLKLRNGLSVADLQKIISQQGGLPNGILGKMI